MSRRARIEEEQKRLLNEELEEEENRIKAQRQRIYAPLVWRRLGSGITIQDLKPAYHEEVLQTIKECYLQEEVLCRNTNMAEDEVSVKSFLDMMTFYLKSNSSIIALDEVNDDAIAGFLIMRVVLKEDFSSVFGRVLPVSGEAHKKCMTFLNFLTRKAPIFEELQCESYLELVLLCIKPEYRSKSLGFHLCSTTHDVARSLNQPVIAGVFSCWKTQKIAKRIGLKTIHEMNYVDWRDRFNELIFEEPGIGNFTCAVMAGAVPPPPAPEPPPPTLEKPEKTTREDKRKAKLKKKAKDN